jgi:hypothetical protein
MNCCIDLIDFAGSKRQLVANRPKRRHQRQTQQSACRSGIIQCLGSARLKIFMS